MKTFKKCFCVLFFMIAFNFSNAQTELLKENQAKDLVNSGVKINKDVVKFGMSLGFNYLTNKVYDVALSPIDNTLQIEKSSAVSFLLSTAIVINPISNYYRKLDSEGNAVGDIYTETSRFSFIATVNLAQFGESQTASFNKKIDGGLGIGLRLSNDFHVALTAEMISVRQPRDYILDNYSGQAIVINDQELNALDSKDNNIFADKYYFGFSVKFIYVIIN